MIERTLCLLLVCLMLFTGYWASRPHPAAPAGVHALAKTKPTVEIRRVVDGDTLALDIQLLDDLWIKDGRMRIVGVNAPEMPTEEGQRAKQFTEEWIAKGGFTVDLRKERDKYGRLLGDLRADRGLLSAALLEKGFAKPYKD